MSRFFKSNSNALEIEQIADSDKVKYVFIEVDESEVERINDSKGDESAKD